MAERIEGKERPRISIKALQPMPQSGAAELFRSLARFTARMTREETKEFASRWLPTWTGNRPEELAAYYSSDAFYCDPGIPNGVEGKDALLDYFRKLLLQNPEWIWKQIEGIPMEGGFLNKWHATIPVGSKDIECVGVCFVQFNSGGLIKRNEVYFDRTELVVENCVKKR